jgi:hypothetical protein
VKPWLLVRTVAPEIRAVFRVVPETAPDPGTALDAGALEAAGPPDPDEPHADAARQAAASTTGAIHLMRRRVVVMTCPHPDLPDVPDCDLPNPDGHEDAARSAVIEAPYTREHHRDRLSGGHERAAGGLLQHDEVNQTHPLCV